MSAADRPADGRPRPGAEQAAADRALARVVGICAPSQPQDEGRRNDAGSDQSIHMSSFHKDRRDNESNVEIVPVDIRSLIMRSNPSIEF
jgi:hypothetical protein